MKILTSFLTFNKESQTFFGSERDIRFATEYEIMNPKTGKSETFKFTHSTGSEFDPKTRWIYEGPRGLKLEIGNDKEITKINARNYLRAKTRSNKH